jgi:hypothetical protein
MSLKCLVAITFFGVALAGCATTDVSRTDKEWSLQTVGRGIQTGAVASAGNAGIFGPILLGFGIMFEQLGIAIDKTGWGTPASTDIVLGSKTGGG